MGAAFTMALLGTGCNSSAKPPAAPTRTDPAPAIGDGRKKDVEIVAEAKTIGAANGANTDPKGSAVIDASVARILDLVRLSPWSRTEEVIKGLVKERDAALAREVKLAADLADAKSATDRIIRLGFAGLGGLGVAGGIFILVASGYLPAAWGLGKQIGGAIAAAGAACIACGIAYTWAIQHLNILGYGAVAVFVAVAVAAYVNRYHEKTKFA